MKKTRYIKYFLGILGVIVVWFVAIDKSYFVETCNDCFWRKNIVKYRLFHIPLSQRITERDSLISKVAYELEVPCQHLHIQHFYKQRWWGLVFCYCPCESGIDGLFSDEQQAFEGIHSKIKSLVEDDPNLPDEFKQRVLVEHDIEYWDHLKEKIFR